MNCVGKGNYGYFLGLLLSLSLMLTYGAYLGYSILDMVLQRISMKSSSQYAHKHWSTGQSWSQYGSMWVYALTLDNRIGGIGLLAMFTAPMAWGFLLYHVYLIWAGMTTNESSKWEDWKYMTSIGIVFKCYRPKTGSPRPSADQEAEPLVPWPASTQQLVTVCENGKPPDFETSPASESPEREASATSQHWTRVDGLHQIENLYDLGFWDNLHDVLPSRVDMPSSI